MTLDLQATLQSARSSSAAWIELESASGSRTLVSRHGDWGVAGVDRRLDISDRAGEVLTVRYVVVDGATVDDEVDLIYDTDGDGLSDARETQGFVAGDGDRIRTDPYSADTDGDGLTDSQEIAALTDDRVTLHTDPTRADTDGDGLDDSRERAGSWQISLTTSVNATQAAVRPGDGTSAAAAATTRQVWTDPTAADSDGDGLDDGRERRLGTDPTAVDSDGDDVRDRAEVETHGTDPTLHDARPPTVRTSRVAVDGNLLSGSDYEIDYTVRDPAGVARVDLLKNGQRRARDQFGGASEASADTSFHVDPVERVIDGWTGTSVDARATDANGVTGRRTVYETGDLASRVAADIGAANGSTPVARQTGRVSGFATSVGESARGVRETVASLTDIEGLAAMIDGLTALVDVLREHGVLDTLTQAVESELERIVDRQRRANPYPRGDELHAEFAASWYGGYVAGSLAKAVSTKGLGKLATSSKTGQKVGSFVDNAGGTRLRRLVTDRGSLRGEVRARLVGSGDEVAQGAETAGSALRSARLVERAGIDVGSLDAGERANLRALLARGGEDAADDLGRLNGDERRDLLSLAGCGRTSGFETTRGDCGLSSAEYDRLYGRLGAFDGDRGAAVDAIESLDSDDRRRVYERLARIDSTRAQSVLAGIEEVDNGAELTALVYRKRAQGVTAVSRPAELFGDLRQLRESDVEIGEEVTSKLTSSQWGNVKGAAYEIEVAARYQREGNNVVAVGYQLSERNTDADVLVRTPERDLIVVEAKNVNSYNDMKRDLGDKLSKMESDTWPDQPGSFDRMVVEFRGDTVPESVTDYIRQKEDMELAD